jgi:hypothetical protein
VPLSSYIVIALAFLLSAAATARTRSYHRWPAERHRQRLAACFDSRERCRITLSRCYLPPDEVIAIARSRGYRYTGHIVGKQRWHMSYMGFERVADSCTPAGRC